MKKIFWGVLLALMTTTVGVAAELDLRDITNNVYRGKGTDEITPSKDGIHYYAANDDFTKIEKWEYKSGKVVATLFDVATARNCNIKSFEGYALSDDETRLLIYTNSEPIYRR